MYNLKFDDTNVNLFMEYSPYQIMKEAKLTRELYKYRHNKKELNLLIQDNMDSVIHYPIILSLLHNLNQSYLQYMKKKCVQLVMKDINSLYQDYDRHDLFKYIPFTSHTLRCLLDNPAIDDKWKSELIDLLFDKIQELNNGRFVWSSLLYHLYSYRQKVKYDELPIQLIELFFDTITFNVKEYHSINHSLFHEDFIKYLFPEELDIIIPQLMNKEHFNEWLQMTNIPSYIWLISKVAAYLPYKFTKEKLLPLITYPFNGDIQEALCSMSHLHSKDKEWIQATISLQQIKSSTK